MRLLLVTAVVGISIALPLVAQASALTWSERTVSTAQSWFSITSSADGTKLAAVVINGYIYTSVDSGATWTAQTSAGAHPWISITSSSDGSKLAAEVTGGDIYTSTDSGA